MYILITNDKLLKVIKAVHEGNDPSESFAWQANVHNHADPCTIIFVSPTEVESAFTTRKVVVLNQLYDRDI